jgi:Ankyrin repeat
MDGIDYNIKDQNGRTPFHILCLDGMIYTIDQNAPINHFQLCAEFLMDHGANIYAQDKDGNAPLHLAMLIAEEASDRYSDDAEWTCTRLLEYLLHQCHMRFDIINHHHRTARDMYPYHDNMEIFDYPIRRSLYSYLRETWIFTMMMMTQIATTRARTVPNMLCITIPMTLLCHVPTNRTKSGRRRRNGE